MRSLVQVIHSLMEEKVRCNARIQASLGRNGVIMPSYKAFSKKWRCALMQYIGSGDLSTELSYEYDHFVFLEKKMKQIEQKLPGYACKN